MPDATDKRFKAGRKIAARYKDSLTVKNPKTPKPKLSAKPKGNPLKGNFGVTLKVKF